MKTPPNKININTNNLLKKYLSGISISDLSILYQCSTATVYRNLKTVINVKEHNIKNKYEEVLCKHCLVPMTCYVSSHRVYCSIKCRTIDQVKSNDIDIITFKDDSKFLTRLELVKKYNISAVAVYKLQNKYNLPTVYRKKELR